jgi:hypothetical protein
MKFYVFTGASNMRRAELVHHQLFDLGHELVQPWQECYQVDRAALAAADALIILLAAGTDAAEVLRCALVAELPVVLWREPSGERLELELGNHPLVFPMRGDLAHAINLQQLAIAAGEVVTNRQAGTFGRGNYGHGPAIAARFGGGLRP